MTLRCLGQSESPRPRSSRGELILGKRLTPGAPFNSVPGAFRHAKERSGLETTQPPLLAQRNKCLQGNRSQPNSILCPRKGLNLDWYQGRCRVMGSSFRHGVLLDPIYKRHLNRCATSPAVQGGEG